MPSKMTFLYGVPLFVGCCTILWMFWDRFKKTPKPPADQICLDKMTDNRKEAAEEEMAKVEAKMEKAIFISGDCWLAVFDLLPAYQLGLRISMISHRFNIYVDEHFKTRKWGLDFLQIGSKIDENGTKEMEIVNFDGEELPIPQNEVPHKVIGFECIIISFIDQNVIGFLRRFRQLFATRPINLAINTYNYRILEFFLLNIWPMLSKNIHGLRLSNRTFHRLRKFVPSILNDCPSLRIINAYDYGFFTGFPCDDSAAASDGQAVAKWLFTARPDNVPKLFKCSLHMNAWTWPSKIEPFKTAFANASSPVNFIVFIWFLQSHFAQTVVPFDLINELTREQLALKRTNINRCFLLIRSPIARDVNKWAEWEEEAIGWKFIDQCDQIDIEINDEHEIGDGLLDKIPGPSDQQK